MFGKKNAAPARPTREDVLWCYRTVLEREPESEAVITEKMTAPSVRDLVAAFFSSDEFARQVFDRLDPRPPLEPPPPIVVHAAAPVVPMVHPLNLPRSRIDVDVSPAELGAAVRKVKAAWTALGLTSAHHSVLTADQFLPENLPGTIADFWQSGAGEAADAVEIFRHHGVDVERATCVEYGCGVGRVTTQLAQHFGQVVGYDISAHHLGYATARATELGLTNLRVHEVAETFLEALEPCDAFYSRIVFQHNPPPIIRELIRLALAALRPGGVAIFQVPTYQIGYSFDAARWLASYHGDGMEMHCVPQPLVFELIAAAGCVPLEVREDGSTGDSRFVSHTFVVRKRI